MEKHFYKQNCSGKEAKFLLSNLEGYKIPHFYFIWKILKNPIIGTSIVARYNWILTPASIFVGHVLKEFFSMFDTILTDSISLIRILENIAFEWDCLLFTIDFTSLYISIPVEDAIAMIQKLGMVFDFQMVIPNAHLIIDLLGLVLRNSLMNFDKEYCQKSLALLWAQT